MEPAEAAQVDAGESGSQRRIAARHRDLPHAP
jgi:hypothetical protein